MKLFFFLLFPFGLAAQTKTTLATLKAKTAIPSTIAKTVFYTIAGTDTTFWKYKPGMFETSDNVLIIKNFKGQPIGAFVKLKPSQLPIVPPVVPTPEPTEKTFVLKNTVIDNPIFIDGGFATFDNLPYVYKGTDTARDFSVIIKATAWEVYLRVVDTIDNGRAIYFKGEGTLISSIGVIQGLNTKNQLRTAYWTNSCCSPGWRYSPPSGDSLKIELSFVDIKITVDGKPYITLTEFDHVDVGTVRLKTPARLQTVTDFSVTYKKRKPTLSDTDKRLFDGRDISIYEMSTVGSIDSLSNVLRVSKGTAKNYFIGQMLVVEAGCTRGFYGRKSGNMGTIDAGGSSPSEWIEDASMLKGIIRPNGYTIADKKTGIRSFTNGQGDWEVMNLYGNGANTGFYRAMSVPLALRPIITGIDAINDVIYLDRTAKATVINAPVTLDCAFAWNRLGEDANYNRYFEAYPRLSANYPALTDQYRGLRAIQRPFKLRLSGKITVSERIGIVGRDDVEVFADDTATIFSPKGVSTVWVFAQGSNRLKWKNIGLQGNVFDSSFTPVVYQFNHATGGPVTGHTLSDYVQNYFPQTFASGFDLGSATGLQFDNFSINDSWGAMGTQNLSYSTFTNTRFFRKYGIRTYSAWVYGFNSGSYGCTLSDFGVETPSVIGGVEFYNSDSCIVKRGRLINATAAANNGRKIFIEDVNITMKRGSMGLYYNENPGLNLNLNAPGGGTSGGYVKDFHINIEGPLDNQSLAMVGFSTQSNVKNVVFENCTYTLASGFLGVDNIVRGIGFSSGGENVILKDFVANVPADYDIRKYGWSSPLILYSGTGSIINSKSISAFYDPLKVRFESPLIKYRWTFVGGAIYINGKNPTIPLMNMNLDNL